MLDFRRHSKVPNYLGSNQQRRLLVILALLGVLAILVFQARDPGRKGWFASTQTGDGVQGAGQPADDETDKTAVADERVSPEPHDRRELFPGVRRDYLDTVEDDTVFRTVEADAWFHLLALLEITDQQDLERASLGRTGYLQLDQQSNEYRGRLVTIDGTVRGAKRVDAPPNGYSIKQYYQLWLQPERGSPALVAVYAIALPEGFPLGTDLDASCAATGFFFKRWAYPTREGIATAPLVLARTVDWQPPPRPSLPRAESGEQFVWALLIAFILALLIVGFFIARERAAKERRRLAANINPLRGVPLSREFESQVDRGNVLGDET